MNSFQKNRKNCYIEFFKLVEKSKLVKKSGFRVALTKGRKIMDVPVIQDIKDNNATLELETTGELITAHTKDNRCISIIPRDNSVRLYFNDNSFDWFIRCDMSTKGNVITFYNREAILRIGNLCKDKTSNDLVIGNSRVSFLPDRCYGNGVQGINIKFFSDRAEIASDIVVGAENIDFSYSLDKGNYDSTNMTKLVEDVSKIFLSPNKHLLRGLSMSLSTIKKDYDEILKSNHTNRTSKQYKKQYKKTRLSLMDI